MRKGNIKEVQLKKRTDTDVLFIRGVSSLVKRKLKKMAKDEGFSNVSAFLRHMIANRLKKEAA